MTTRSEATSSPRLCKRSWPPPGEGGPHELVPPARREIEAQRGHIDRHVRHALRQVADDDRSDRMGAASDLGDRVDRAERVADVAHRHETRLADETGAEVIEVQPAVIGDADVLEVRQVGAALGLPREVGRASCRERVSPYV